MDGSNVSPESTKNEKDTAPRETFRLPFEAKVNIEFEKFTGFITEYSANISEGGIFIKTKDSKPVGTVLSFEFKLRDNFKLMQGLGEVVWVRTEDLPPDKPAGMGIRFHDIDAQSKELIRTMIENHMKSGGKLFDLDDRTPRAVDPPKGNKNMEEDFAALFAVPTSPSASLSPPPPLSEPPKVPTKIPPKDIGMVIEDEAVADTSVRPVPGLSSLNFGFEPPRMKKSRAPLWTTLILILISAGGAGYWYQDFLLQFIFGKASSKTAQPVAQQSKSTPSSASTVQAVPTQTASAVATPNAETAKAESNPPAPLPPLSEIENITWVRDNNGTVVTLWGNGSIAADCYSHVRVEGRSPREVLKILRIAKAYPYTKVSVQTAEVRQIRTGYHVEGTSGELHVVVDLPHSSIRVQKIEAGDSKLTIHLGK